MVRLAIITLNLNCATWLKCSGHWYFKGLLSHTYTSVYGMNSLSSAGIIVHWPMCNISDTGTLTLDTVHSYDDDFSLVVVLDHHRRISRGSYRPTSPLRDYQVGLCLFPPCTPHTHTMLCNDNFLYENNDATALALYFKNLCYAGMRFIRLLSYFTLF